MQAQEAVQTPNPSEPPDQQTENTCIQTEPIIRRTIQALRPQSLSHSDKPRNRRRVIESWMMPQSVGNYGNNIRVNNSTPEDGMQPNNPTHREDSTITQTGNDEHEFDYNTNSTGWDSMNARNTRMYPYPLLNNDKIYNLGTNITLGSPI